MRHVRITLAAGAALFVQAYGAIPASAQATETDYELCVTSEMLPNPISVQVGTTALTFSGADPSCRQTSAHGEVSASSGLGRLVSCGAPIPMGNKQKISLLVDRQRVVGPDATDVCSR